MFRCDAATKLRRNQYSFMELSYIEAKRSIFCLRTEMTSANTVAVMPRDQHQIYIDYNQTKLQIVHRLVPHKLFVR